MLSVGPIRRDAELDEAIDSRDRTGLRLFGTGDGVVPWRPTPALPGEVRIIGGRRPSAPGVVPSAAPKHGNC